MATNKQLVNYRMTERILKERKQLQTQETKTGLKRERQSLLNGSSDQINSKEIHQNKILYTQGSISM